MDHLRFKSEQTAAAYVADGLDEELRDQFELHMMECPECVDEVEVWRALKTRLPAEATRLGYRGPETSRNLPDATATAATSPPADAVPTATPSQSATGLAPGAPSVPAAHSVAAVQPSPAPAVASDGGASGSPAPKPAGSRRTSPPAAPLASSVGLSSARWRIAAGLAAGLIVGAAGGWYGRLAQGPSLASDSVGFYSLPPLMRGPADCTPVQVGPQVQLIALRVPAAAKEQQLVAVDSEGHDLAPDAYSVRMQADGSWLVRLRAETIRDQGIRFEARSADGTVEPRGCVLSGSRD